MPRIVTIEVGVGAVKYTVEQDCSLLAALVLAAPYRDALGGDVWQNETGSVLISFDSTETWTSLSTASPIPLRNSTISFGGILPFPVLLGKGEAIFISAFQFCQIQLWLADP